MVDVIDNPIFYFIENRIFQTKKPEQHLANENYYDYIKKSI